MVSGTKLKAIVLAATLAWSAWMPQAVHAAGLGKISVMSNLGQPLKAEIDLTAVSREEATSIAAKLASPDAFKTANIEFQPALLGLKFAVNKRPDGQFYISVTSIAPINEPFVDMLVELNWATGRLVREYTFLLDPTDMQLKPVRVTEATPTAVTPPVAVAPPVARPPAPTAAVTPPKEATSLPKPVEPAPSNRDARPAPLKKDAAPKAAPAAGSTAGTVEVKKGDTLGKIAKDNLADGVSLDQMLVALQRANPNAFINNNVNLLKSGVILNLPDKDAANAVASSDARRLVVAQTADFREYQNKLAGTAAATPATKADAPKQTASGKVTTSVADKTKTKPDSKDQLKLSKADTPAKSGKASGVKAAEEDLIARDRAVKDAQGRVSTLEKNVQDLQKLLEMKNQELAKQQASALNKTAAAEAKASADKTKADLAKAKADETKAKADAAVKAKEDAIAKANAAIAEAKTKAEIDAKAKADAAKSAVDAKAAAEKSVADKAKSDAETKVAAAKAEADAKAITDKAALDKATSDKAASDKAAADKAPADKAAATGAKAAEVPPEPPKVADAPKADAPKSDILKADAPKKVVLPAPLAEKSLVDEFTENPMYLAVGGGLIAALAGYGIYAVRRKRKYEKFENSVITGGDLKANSVFGSTGGQSIDTGNSSFQSDFSQIGTSQIDADEVDPVAEADVYMAYGRDQQAEEILKEALSKDPNRQTVRMKLLDIYSTRGDRKSFEMSASELYASTGGTGEAWAQVRTQGQTLDPTNPLYGGVVNVGGNDITKTLDLGTAAAMGAAGVAVAGVGAAAANMFPAGGGVFGKDALEKTMELSALGSRGAAPSTPNFADDPLAKTIALDAVNANAVQAIDLDFDLDLTRTSDNADIVVLDQAATDDVSLGGGLDFDLGFGSSDPVPVAAPRAPTPAPVFAPAPATDFAPGGTLIVDGPLLDDAPTMVLPQGSFGQAAAIASVSLAALPDVPSVDFDLGGSSGTLEAPKIESIEAFTKTVQMPSGPDPLAKSGIEEAPSVDFDFDLGGAATVVLPSVSKAAAGAALTGLSTKPVAQVKSQAAALDMELSTISLDLTKATQVAQNTLWQEIATKLDLAKAYDEMGDKDGARELLHEVLKEGDKAQKDAATKLLAVLG